MEGETWGDEFVDVYDSLLNSQGLGVVEDLGIGWEGVLGIVGSLISWGGGIGIGIWFGIFGGCCGGWLGFGGIFCSYWRTGNDINILDNCNKSSKWE